MTSFKDGPAKGKTLQLRRAPYFLRVVIDEAGEVDALDQPDDTPKDREHIIVYRLTAPPGWCHIRSGKKGASGFYPIAEYEMHPDRPDANWPVREKKDWDEWCEQHRAEFEAAAAKSKS